MLSREERRRSDGTGGARDTGPSDAAGGRTDARREKRVVAHQRSVTEGELQIAERLSERLSVLESFRSPRARKRSTPTDSDAVGHKPSIPSPPKRVTSTDSATATAAAAAAATLVQKAPIPLGRSSGSSVASCHTDDIPSDAMRTFESMLREKEKMMQTREKDLSKAASAARREVLAVRKEKECLALELKQAMIQIEELQKNWGVLVAKHRDVVSQQEASQSAGANGRSDAKVAVLQAELNGVKQCLKAAAIVNGQQKGQSEVLPASQSAENSFHGLLESGGSFLSSADEDNMQQLKDMRESLQNQIYILKEQLHTVCQNDACQSPEEIMKLLWEHKDLQEKYKMAVAELDAERIRIQQMEHDDRKNQQYVLDLKSKIMDIQGIIDEKGQGWSSPSASEDSILPVSPRYLDALASKAELEAELAEVKRDLRDAQCSSSRLECKLLDLQYQQKRSQAEVDFANARTRELVLQAELLSQKVHKHEAKSTSAKESLRLKEQTLQEANSNLLNVNRQCSIYQQEIQELKEKVEDLEAAAKNEEDLNSRIQSRELSLQQISQMHQQHCSESDQTSARNSEPVMASDASGQSSRDRGRKGWQHWVEFAVVKVAIPAIALVVWRRTGNSREIQRKEEHSWQIPKWR